MRRGEMEEMEGKGWRVCEAGIKVGDEWLTCLRSLVGGQVVDRRGGQICRKLGESQGC